MVVCLVMGADQAGAAVFALNDSDLSSLSGDSSDISADSTGLWLSSDSSADEDGDSDDTLDLDDEQEGTAGSDTLGDDLNDSSDEDGVEPVSDRLVNISFCYVTVLVSKAHKFYQLQENVWVVIQNMYKEWDIWQNRDTGGIPYVKYGNNWHVKG